MVAVIRRTAVGGDSARIHVAQGTAPSGVPPSLATSTAPLVFRGVTVIDVRAGRHLPNQTVVIVGNRIHALGPAKAVRVPSGARVIEARGQYLIPGLWDMHTHIHEYIDIVSPLLIANGVTGVRDVGSSPPLATLGQWKREIAAGTRIGPRLLVSGPRILQGAGQADDTTKISVNEDGHPVGRGPIHDTTASRFATGGRSGHAQVVHGDARGVLRLGGGGTACGNLVWRPRPHGASQPTRDVRQRGHVLRSWRTSLLCVSSHYESCGAWEGIPS